MSMVGETIKAARARRKLSLAQLAQASGLTKGFLSQIESGRSNPSLASLGRIAQALGMQATNLLADANAATGTLLVPSLPINVPVMRTIRAGGHVEILQATEGGAHLIVELTPDVELSSRLAHEHTPVLCVPLEGSAKVVQPDGSLSLIVGSVAAWDGGMPYAVQTVRNSPARLLLFVPSALSLPTLHRLSRSEPPVSAGTLAQPRAVPARSVAGPAGGPGAGPLKLVAMRAQRLAERKRHP
ncbi:MAG: helix-turn-helix domain-containing protein [Chloroflexia bacterium]